MGVDYNKADPELHTFVRAFERYKRKLSDADYNDMLAQIRSQPQRAYFIGRAKGPAAVYMVYWNDARCVVPVVYNKNRKKIVTMLYRQGIEDQYPLVNIEIDNLLETVKGPHAP